MTTPLEDATQKWQEAYPGMWALPYYHPLGHGHPMCWRCYKGFRRICKVGDLRRVDGECIHRRATRLQIFEHYVKRCANARVAYVRADQERQDEYASNRVDNTCRVREVQEGDPAQ